MNDTVPIAEENQATKFIVPEVPPVPTQVPPTSETEESRKRNAAAATEIETTSQAGEESKSNSDQGKNKKARWTRLEENASRARSHCGIRLLPKIKKKATRNTI